MKADKIERILRALHVDRITSTLTAKGMIVRSSCPLAPWTHKMGRDKRPSFAVFAVEDDESHCKCLSGSCLFRGTMKDLLWKIHEKMEKKSKIKIKRLINDLQDGDQRNPLPALDRMKHEAGFFSIPHPDDSIAKLYSQGRDYSDILSMADTLTPLPATAERTVSEMVEMLHDRSWAEAMGIDPLHYLDVQRKLRPETIAKWKIGWHPTARRIAIPQYDRNGRLMNVGGRYIPCVTDNWEPPPWMHALGFKKEMFLFGEDHLVYEASGKGTVFLVEGMFDVIWLDGQEIPNVVGMLGADLSRYQRQKILRWFDRLVIIPDGDEAGYKVANQIMDSFGKQIETHIFPTPSGLDPDQLSNEHLNEIRSRFVS